MNVTVLGRSWKSRDANLPDFAAREDGWEVESLILPCEVLLGNFGIIEQVGGVEFTAVNSEGIKSIILVSCLVHSSKF